MDKLNKIPVSRIEAFSDGVIAIIITVMVFDLKLQEISNASPFKIALEGLLPKFVSYFLSFLFLSIMWLNHHQLFHQIAHSSRPLIWHNMLLLFSMSLVPFGTNLIGSNPYLWQSFTIYGLIFSLCVISFILLRKYLIRSNLLKEAHSKDNHQRVNRKNYIALSLYLIASVAGYFSIYISLVLILMVPAMYVFPEKTK